jgi:putative ABC transport system permease protein
VGFDPSRLLTFQIQPSEARYGPDAAPALLDRVIAAIQSVPGVRSVTVDGCAPLGTSCANSTLYIMGEPEPPPGRAPPVMRHYVAPDHFKTLGVPLLEGRAFTDQDRAGGPRVTVVNRTAARRFWPEGRVLGQRVWFGGGSTFDRPDSSAEIVGIVGDVPYGALERGPVPSFYTPYRQFTYAFRTVMVKTEGAPLALAPAIRSAVASATGLAIVDVRAMEDRLGDGWARTRFITRLMAVFAALAILLAVGGIYGVIAQTVNRRTRELGIRMALGATGAGVLRLVVGQGLKLAGIGVGIGTVSALALGRVVRGLLFGVSAMDPLVFTGQIGLILRPGIGSGSGAHCPKAPRFGQRWNQLNVYS